MRPDTYFRTASERVTGPLRVVSTTVAAWGQSFVNSESSLAAVIRSFIFASAAATSIFCVLCSGAPGATSRSSGAGPRRAAWLLIVNGVVWTVSATILPHHSVVRCC